MWGEMIARERHLAEGQQMFSGSDVLLDAGFFSRLEGYCHGHLGLRQYEQPLTFGMGLARYGNPASLWR